MLSFGSVEVVEAATMCRLVVLQKVMVLESVSTGVVYRQLRHSVPLDQESR